jgi:hypothetical protein
MKVVPIPRRFTLAITAELVWMPVKMTLETNNMAAIAARPWRGTNTTLANTVKMNTYRPAIIIEGYFAEMGEFAKMGLMGIVIVNATMVFMVICVKWLPEWSAVASCVSMGPHV